MYTRLAGATFATLLLPLAGGPSGPDAPEQAGPSVLWAQSLMDYFDDRIATSLRCEPADTEIAHVRDLPAIPLPAHAALCAFPAHDNNLKLATTSEEIFDASTRKYMRRDIVSLPLGPDIPGVALRAQAEEQVLREHPGATDILDQSGAGTKGLFTIESKWPGFNRDSVELGLSYLHDFVQTKGAADSLRSAFTYQLPQSWLPLPVYVSSDLSVDTLGGDGESLSLSSSIPFTTPYRGRPASSLRNTLGMKRQANAGARRSKYSFEWSSAYKLNDRVSLGVNTSYTPAPSAWQTLFYFQISAPARSVRSFFFTPDGAD